MHPLECIRGAIVQAEQRLISPGVLTSARSAASALIVQSPKARCYWLFIETFLVSRNAGMTTIPATRVDTKSITMVWIAYNALARPTGPTIHAPDNSRPACQQSQNPR